MKRLTRGVTALAFAAASSVGLGLASTTATAAARPHDDQSTSVTRYLRRSHLVNGSDVTVDSRTFTATIGATDKLRDRQTVAVSWKGAHPTGGLVSDPNSGPAAQQEYPVVIMQCRGTAATLSQSTCWTQTPAERYESDYSFNYPPFRVDRYGSATDRDAVVGQPNPVPSACSSTATGIQHWVPYVAADGKVYPGGLNGCAGLAPEASNNDAQLQPSNTTYGATALDGTGQASFVVQTDESNASIGCNNTVDCSLVIVPIMGISCDAQGQNAPDDDKPTSDVVDKAYKECSATGQFAPGSQSYGIPDAEDLTVSGELWWSQSNWRNRIAVPLSFAPPSNVCSTVNAGSPSLIYGSQLMAQATQQWAPKFCLDKSLFPFQHVQTSEVEAKNLLSTGSIEAAFQGIAPSDGFSKPVVQAPAALSGFSISYDVDDANGKPYHSLKLTPRLLAKLLSESYPSNPTVKSDYAALSNNPESMLDDPEFRALNPNMMTSGYKTEAASTLYAMSSDSDVMTALTTYLNDDPDARAFLDGKPDPWGMVVNPNYKGIALPVSQWPQLDTAEPGNLYQPQGNNCLATNPVPYLPLVAAPVTSLATITLNLQFGIANSQTVCQNAGASNQKLVAIGREAPGFRFIVGVNGLADSRRYQIDSAALQTTVSPSAAAKFTSDAGRTFVAPTDAALTAGAEALKPSDTLGSWAFPYSSLATSASLKGAYPGTMLMSMDVPVTGLPAADAKRYAILMRAMAGTLQVPGLGSGQLPDGYLPMTSSNHLSAEAVYTLAAASAVQKQAGVIPKVSDPTVTVAPVTSPDAGTKPPGTTTTTASGSPHTAGSGPAPNLGTVTPRVSPRASGPNPEVAPNGSATRPVASVGITPSTLAQTLGYALPVLLGLAAVSGFGALVLRLGSRPRT